MKKLFQIFRSLAQLLFLSSQSIVSLDSAALIETARVLTKLLFPEEHCATLNSFAGRDVRKGGERTMVHLPCAEVSNRWLIPSGQVRCNEAPENRHTKLSVEMNTMHVLRHSTPVQATFCTVRDERLSDDTSPERSKAEPHRVPTLENMCVEYIIQNNAKYSKLDLPPYLLEVLANRMQISRLITDENVVFFADLSELNLSHNKVTDVGMLRMLSIPRSRPLISINASDTAITDRTIEGLSLTCSDVRNLDVSNCKVLSAKGLTKALKCFTKLQSLSIANLPKANKELMVQILGLPNLQNFRCDGCFKDLKLYPTQLPRKGHGNDHLMSLLLPDVQCSTHSLGTIISSCEKLRMLNLDGSKVVDDTLLNYIASALKHLSGFSIANTPLVTDVGISELRRAKNLRFLNVANNPQISYATLHALAREKTNIRLVGNVLHLKIIRDQLTLSPFVIRANEFDRLEDVVRTISTRLDSESDSTHGNKESRASEHLRLHKVTYRRNGTKRPGSVIPNDKYGHFVAEVLEDRLYLYVNQEAPIFLNNRAPPLSGSPASSNIIFITLRLWDAVDPELQVTKNVHVPDHLNVSALKQLLYDRKLISFLPSEALIVEEENSFKANILSQEHFTLKQHRIVSGDILHIEKIADDFHRDALGQIVRSRIGGSLSSCRKMRIKVQETKESYRNRRKYINLSSSDQCLYFEIVCRSDLTLFRVKQLITGLAGLDVESTHLSTYAEPHLVIRDDGRLAIDVIRRNTCILLTVRISIKTLFKWTCNAILRFVRGR